MKIWTVRTPTVTRIQYPTSGAHSIDYCSQLQVVAHAIIDRMVVSQKPSPHNLYVTHTQNLAYNSLRLLWDCENVAFSQYQKAGFIEDERVWKE